MRPIDAHALFEKAFQAWGVDAGEDEANIFMAMINDAPTISDDDLQKQTIERFLRSLGTRTEGGVRVSDATIRKLRTLAQEKGFLPHE